MLKKVKKFQERTNFIIFLGTGLYQISIGLIANLLVSILLGASIIIFYPIINALILRIFMIIGWSLISIGIFTVIFPLLKNALIKKEIIYKIFLIFLKFSAYITLLLIPIGIFLGNGLRLELKAIKVNETMQKKRKEERKEIYSFYYFLISLTGVIHVILGIFLLFVLIPIISKEINFLFPYVTYEFLSVFCIFGWFCFIPGIILTFCSIWSKKLSIFKQNGTSSYYIKFIRFLILGSAVFLIIIFPIGTFFSLFLIQEFYHSNIKEE